MEQILDLYRDLNKIPIISDAYFTNCNGENSLIGVSSIWSQVDLVRNERTKLSRDYIVIYDKYEIGPNQPKIQCSSIPYALNENSRALSFSGNLTATLSELAPKKRSSSSKPTEKSEFIEIFNNSSKETTIDLKSLEKHGKIHTEFGFGTMRFSYGEGHLLYVAEKFRKTVNYFDSKKKFDEEKFDPNDDEYIFRQNWGEQLTEIKEPVICILDIASGEVTVLDNLPENVSPCQPVWAPNDEGVVFVGLNETPSKLGYVVCFNRKSRLYYYNIASATCQPLADYEAAFSSPRFSPDCSKFVFVESKIGGTHKKCEILKLFDWSTKKISTVVDVVEAPENGPPSSFFGLFDASLPNRCWSLDNQRVLLTSISQSKTEIFVVNTNSGQIKCLTDKGTKYGSWRLLDVFNDHILAQNSSPNRPPSLLFARLPPNGQENDLIWIKLDKDSPRPFERLLSEIKWRYVAFRRSPAEGEPAYFADLQYEGILITPSDKDKLAPLIAMPHGGPHGTYVATWLPAVAFFVLSGFAVLRINYRGSLGFGEKFVQSLPGRVGQTDVLDCKHALDATLANLGDSDAALNPEQPAAPNRRRPVFVYGGSHGGFLATHLIGRFPEYFKAAVAMNPVINIATMLGTSDIPDWAYFESFGVDYDQSKPINDEEMKVMWKKSPISHVDKVRTPLLLLIGESDLRVPPSQSKEYARILKARNVPLKVMSYPSNNHLINSVDCDANLMINALKWFHQYL